MWVEALELLLQKMADVFQCPVVRQESTNSAAHAWHLYQGHELLWNEVMRGFTDTQSGSRIAPNLDAAPTYDRLGTNYQAKERL